MTGVDLVSFTRISIPEGAIESVLDSSAAGSSVEFQYPRVQLRALAKEREQTEKS